jgi:alpha-beta hydrolase superfamily lysophospholipase
MKSKANLPPIKHYFGEIRIVRDWARGRRMEEWLATAYPCGAKPGQPRVVIVIPGLFTSDNRTTMLRRVLRKAGYRTYGWGLGRNMPIKADLLDRFEARVAQILDKEKASHVTLVGWSLGGLVARSYAHHKPDHVAEVITLGSPFSGDPRANRAWQIYELAADHKVDAPPIPIDFSVKPPCPTTAIWSPRDGIIAAESARGEPHERDAEVEVNCGHFAMSIAPDALEAVLKILKTPSS